MSAETKRCSFGWKRKFGETLDKATSESFEKNTAPDKQVELEDGTIDWLSMMPTNKKMCLALEDNVQKQKRLMDEGAILADADRPWEAIKKFDEALLLTQERNALHKLHDMKSQAYRMLNEVDESISSAQKSLTYDPLDWETHQTLGRAYLGAGQLQQALDSFSRAIHLNPTSEELLDEDFSWTVKLLQQQQQAWEHRDNTCNPQEGTDSSDSDSRDSDGCDSAISADDSCGDTDDTDVS